MSRTTHHTLNPRELVAPEALRREIATTLNEVQREGFEFTSSHFILLDSEHGEPVYSELQAPGASVSVSTTILPVAVYAEYSNNGQDLLLTGRNGFALDYKLTHTSPDYRVYEAKEFDSNSEGAHYTTIQVLKEASKRGNR